MRGKLRIENYNLYFQTTGTTLWGWKATIFGPKPTAYVWATACVSLWPTCNPQGSSLLNQESNSSVSPTQEFRLTKPAGMSDDDDSWFLYWQRFSQKISLWENSGGFVTQECNFLRPKFLKVPNSVHCYVLITQMTSLWNFFVQNISRLLPRLLLAEDFV